MPPKLVIFDCDGVLVDSEMIASRVLAGELSRLGLKITAAGCRRRFTGISMSSVRAMLEKDLGHALDPGFEERLRLLDAAAFEKDLAPVDGIERALREIPFPVCVASSGSPEKIANSLRITGLTDYFDGNLFSAAMVENGKPAPDLFLLAADHMGVSPVDAVVIEDSASGVIAAALAGMRVLGFSGASHARNDAQYPAKLIAAGAADVFDDMARLPRLLGL